MEYDESTQTLHDRPILSEQELLHRMAWQSGWIIMDGLPLSEALAELARYQPATMFRYANESLAHLRVGGNVNVAAATHLEDFLDWLEQSQHIHHAATVGADGMTIITLSQRR